MLIAFRHNHCIWCEKTFSISGFRARFGEVQRSDEHIIPDNLFGRIKTNDVCVGCNSLLGMHVDDRLRNDFHVFNAGRDAGLKIDELLPVFRVSGTTPDGEPFEYTVKRGVWRLNPSFHKGGFKIGSVNGAARESDLLNAKKKMLAMVKGNTGLGVSETEAVKFVNALFDEFMAKQAQSTVFNKRIKQGLRARPIPSKGAVNMVTHPWQTQWAIGKAMYETGATMLPDRLRRRVQSALHQIRQFVEARAEGRGILKHKTLSRTAAQKHEVEIRLKGSALTFAVRLFNREQWSVSFVVLCRGAVARLTDYRLTVINDWRPGVRETVKVLENGKNVAFYFG
jgi:hypothetical protein